MSFYEDIRKWSEKTKKDQDKIVVAAIFQLNESVIFRTPVATGQARGGWVASIGSVGFSGGTFDKSGRGTYSKTNTIASKAPGNVYYLTNNVFHIRMLEYGGYPKTPIKGTWNKSKQKYEILSSGGFSRQAPQGMVRVSIIDFKNGLKNA